MMMRFLILVVLVVSVSGSQKNVSRCPASIPRDQYLRVFGDVCYVFHLWETRNFNGAESTCQATGGHLVSVTSRAINNFLVQTLLGYQYCFDEVTCPVWIGLNDQLREHRYMWTDGRSLDTTGYTHWKTGEGTAPGYNPYHDYEDCVFMSPYEQGVWYDVPCTAQASPWSFKHVFICQYDMLPVATTSTPATKAPISPSTTTTTTTTTAAASQSTGPTLLPGWAILTTRR